MVLGIGLASLTMTVGFDGAAAEDRVLVGFERGADISAWTNVDINALRMKDWQAAADLAQKDGKAAPPKPAAAPAEPAAKLELSSEGGKSALKITFNGGHWPLVGTATIQEMDWSPYKSMQVDMTAPRECLVGVRFRQEKTVFDKTAFLKSGKNTIDTGIVDTYQRRLLPNPAGGKLTAFEIFMYDPHPGESLLLEGVRLSTNTAPIPGSDFNVFPKKADGGGGKPEFTVLGTNLTVTDVGDLGKRLRDKWVQQESKSLEQIESEFRAQYEEFKKTHPKAVLAVFRDADKGFDPKQPDKVYEGWKDAYINSHGPDGNLDGRAAKNGKAGSSELFMRHRGRLMQVDLSSIPTGSTILAATFILTKGNTVPPSVLATNAHADTVTKANMWVAEPCCREWDEYEVNAYQYAKDKFWKAIGGTYYGDDPDFLPLFAAYGAATGNANAFDFTEAVKFWTGGQHRNCGFFWHSDSNHYFWFPAPTREAKEVKSRPAVLAIYEPKD